VHILQVAAAQVEGKHGMAVLKNKMAKGGVPVLYHGALAASGATFVGKHPYRPPRQSYHCSLLPTWKSWRHCNSWSSMPVRCQFEVGMTCMWLQDTTRGSSCTIT
jgi:hypothetical protein